MDIYPEPQRLISGSAKQFSIVFAKDILHFTGQIIFGRVSLGVFISRCENIEYDIFYGLAMGE